MNEVMAITPFEVAMRRNPNMVLSILSRGCVVLFEKYYDTKEVETQREIGRDLLVALTNFFQARNLKMGRGVNEGIASIPYLSTLRKVLVSDGITTIPPLPIEVYAALP